LAEDRCRERRGRRRIHVVCQVWIEKTSANESLLTCRNCTADIKTGGDNYPRDEPTGSLLTGWVVSGIEVA